MAHSYLYFFFWLLILGYIFKISVIGPLSVSLNSYSIIVKFIVYVIRLKEKHVELVLCCRFGSMV